MVFNREFIRRIADSTDLVSLISSRGITLKKTGNSFKGLCPFHSEKTASFNVNPQQGFFHCFGCGASGDAIKFLVLHDRLSFSVSVLELAKLCGVEPVYEAGKGPKSNTEEDIGLKCLHEAEVIYHNNLLQGKYSEVLDYLDQRMVAEKQWKLFRLGFAQEGWQNLTNQLNRMGFNSSTQARTGLNTEHEESGRRYDRFRRRLIFPIHDLHGRCVGFGGRVIRTQDRPKYLNSPETPYYRKSLLLYGMYEGLDEIRKKKEIICVEGYFDVIRLHEHGFRNAVAPCGTAMTGQHLNLIKRYSESIVLLFDGDNAGREAARRHVRICLHYALDASIVLLPDGEDPDSFLLKNGSAALSHLIDKKIPVLDFLLDQMMSRHSTSLKGRIKALEEILPILSEIDDTILRQITINSLSEKMKLPFKELWEKSKKFLIKSNDYAKQDVLRNNPDESRDERWIIQTLLKSKESSTQVRKHLKPDELNSPRLREIYKALLKYPAEFFDPFDPQPLETDNPKLYQAIIALSMEGVPQHEYLLSLKRIKEKNIHDEFQEQKSQGSYEERLHAGIEYRRKIGELKSLMENLS